MTRLNWFNEKGYFQGVFWMIMASLVGNLNDVVAKFVGGTLPPMEVSWFRFFFSFLTLVPFMLYYRKTAFKTSKPFIHILRGVILFVAIASWIYALSVVHLTLATVLSFTVPIFVIVMAALLLKEHVTPIRWIATFIGFIGILVSINVTQLSLNPMALLLLVAAFMFATLDIINKKIVVKESMLAMLFYSALVTAILGAYPAYLVWQAPHAFDVFLLFLLGGGANLILFCILKAFSAVEVSALVPYRYTELLFSLLFGVILFAEIPTFYTIVGACIIIPTTLFLAYTEGKSQK